jgi:hypothetical protein
MDDNKLINDSVDFIINSLNEFGGCRYYFTLQYLFNR